MKLDISDVIRINGATLEVKLSEKISDLEVENAGYIFDKPIEFIGQIVNISGVLKLSGHLTVEYSVECYRCLKVVDRKANIIINESIINSQAATDTETYTYEGDYLEILKILKDNIILNLPMKQVCNEECKGLCVQCGTNLNEKVCNCEDETINPQFDKLKDLFKEK